MFLRGRVGTLCVGLAATLLASAVGLDAASAATLGGVAAPTISAQAFASSSGAKTVLAWENFDGTNGANLNGTTTDGGSKVWAVNPSGTWTINANRARSTTANSSLVINPGVWNSTTVATVARGGTTFDGGFTFNRNAAGTQFLTCEWTSGANGSIELWKYDAGGWTALASVTNLAPGGIATAPASIVLGCGTDATSIFATIDGTVVTSATLSAADRTTFFRAANQLTGPYQWTANSMRWDDFHVDAP